MRDILRLSPIVVPGILLVFVWQNVKGEYRQFLNGGHFSQQVVVSQTEALTKFQELATDAMTSTRFARRKHTGRYLQKGGVFGIFL